MPHVFDQTNMLISSSGIMVPDDTPLRYLRDGATLSFCQNDWEISNGSMLFSGSMMLSQKSCRANTGNAGNYYSFNGISAGNNTSRAVEAAANSVCPRGWILPIDNTATPKGWGYLLRTTYGENITSKDVVNLPLSLLITGWYSNTNGPYFRDLFTEYLTNTGNVLFYSKDISVGITPSRSSTLYEGQAAHCVAR